MFNASNNKIEEFKRVKGNNQEEALDVKHHVTFYRTKPGCYTPPPYQLKYRKLSEVL